MMGGPARPAPTGEGPAGILRVWRGDEEVDPPEISPRDRGVTLGFGVFETVRLYRGIPFRLDRHLSRLREGAGSLGVPVPPSMEERVEESLARIGELDARLRITLTGGEGGSAGAGEGGALVVDVSPWSPQEAWYREGVTGGSVSAPRTPGRLTAGAKTTSRAETVLAMEEARRSGFHEGLWRDEAGRWVEGTASNLFVVVEGVVRTSPLDSGCLAGVTREAVLQLAAEGGIPAETDRLLEPEVFRKADEAFLSSSLRELLPLVSVDRRPVGRGTPGPLWAELRSAYRKLVASEVGAPP